MVDDKAIIYVDMDHVLCDYDDGFIRHQEKYPDLEFPQSQPGLYIGLKPMPEAIETYEWLDSHPRTLLYILTAPSIRNSHCYSEKRDWVERHLGFNSVRNLIISPHKHLCMGDYLVDDMPSGKGQDNFQGELILFGSVDFPDWVSVRAYFESVL